MDERKRAGGSEIVDTWRRRSVDAGDTLVPLI